MGFIEPVFGFIGGVFGFAVGLVGAVLYLVVGGIGLVMGLVLVGLVHLLVAFPQVLVIAGLALLVNTQFMQESSWAWIPIIGLAGAGLFASLRRPVDDTRQTAFAE